MKSFHIVSLFGILVIFVGCSDNFTVGGEVNSPGYIEGQDTAALEDGSIGQDNIDSQNLTTEYFNFTIGDKVYFELDQSTLSEPAKMILAEQATWLNQNPSFIAVIEGHADERGTREYNLALGARRADAVRTYLLQNGVNDSRISVVSYGKERPFVACSEESCWSQNRRARTSIKEGLGI